MYKNDWGVTKGKILTSKYHQETTNGIEWIIITLIIKKEGKITDM